MSGRLLKTLVVIESKVPFIKKALVGEGRGLFPISTILFKAMEEDEEISMVVLSYGLANTIARVLPVTADSQTHRVLIQIVIQIIKAIHSGECLHHFPCFNAVVQEELK